jgi:hypothetical protein
MFRCLNPGCPLDCGTRRTPGCADRLLLRALALLLVTVLLGSLWMGFHALREAAG